MEEGKKKKKDKPKQDIDAEKEKLRKLIQASGAQKEELRKQMRPRITKAPPPISPVSGLGGGVSQFSPKKPDYLYWKRLDLWTLGKAVCLICNCDPEELESKSHPLRDSYSYKDDNRANGLRRIYRMAITSIKVEALKIRTHYNNDLYKEVLPHEFIEWAKSKELPIPDELIEVLEGSKKEEVTQKNKVSIEDNSTKANSDDPKGDVIRLAEIRQKEGRPLVAADFNEKNPDRDVLVIHERHSHLTLDTLRRYCSEAGCLAWSKTGPKKKNEN